MWVFSIIGRNKNERRNKKRPKEPFHQNHWKVEQLRMLRCLGKDPLLDPSRRKSLYRRQELGHPLDP